MSPSSSLTAGPSRARKESRHEQTTPRDEQDDEQDGEKTSRLPFAPADETGAVAQDDQDALAHHQDSMEEAPGTTNAAHPRERQHALAGEPHPACRIYKVFSWYYREILSQP